MTYSVPSSGFDSKVFRVGALKPLFGHVEGFSFLFGSFDANLLMLVDPILGKISTAVVTFDQVITWLGYQTRSGTAIGSLKINRQELLAMDFWCAQF